MTWTWFESSVNSEYSKTQSARRQCYFQFESSVNSEYSKTTKWKWGRILRFESSVNSEYSKTADDAARKTISLRVV